jgi:hypothetical protein
MDDKVNAMRQFSQLIYMVAADIILLNIVAFSHSLMRGQILKPTFYARGAVA